MTEGELREQIDFEYECMKMGFLIGSRENLFQHAAEIAEKTRIYRWLRGRLIFMEPEEMEKLSRRDHLIDEIYASVKGEEEERDLQNKITRWYTENIKRKKG